MTVIRVLRLGSIAAGAAILCAGCGIYSFSGSTLPGYLKTVDIPLFINQSSQPGVAEKLTEELSRQVQSTNLLRITSSQGDATITGKVIDYTHHPYTYDSRNRATVDVEQYAVRILVEVEFLDNKKGDPLYKGQVRGEGVYDFKTGKEEDGRDKAIKQVADQILQNSVQSW